jgi:indole-3-glycerol phosphate synthase
MRILDEIVESTRRRVEEAVKKVPLPRVREKAREAAKTTKAGAFHAALAAGGVSIIGEIKRASPSKGIIADEFPYLEIAETYEKAGVAAFSVLTEPFFFKGEERCLRDIARARRLPVLRKDFIVDEYQIYETKSWGASAVLFICALLEDARLRDFLALAGELGLDALTEAHDRREAEAALAAGAQIIGVNNRDLSTFEVDLETSLRLRALIPRDRLFVAESGIESEADMRALAAAGVDAALIGEALMRSLRRGAYIGELLAAGREGGGAGGTR